MLFSEAIEKFSTWRRLKVKGNTVKGYDLALRSFCVFLRDPEIEAITLDNVIEWFYLQEKLGWDRNGFIPKAIAIRKIFEFYQHQGVSVLDPWLIPIPDKEYKKPRVLSEENYKKLLAAFAKDGRDPKVIRNEAIVRMLWDTGGRNNEILSLNVQDIDTEKMQSIIRTEKAKTRKPMRQIFWTESTNEMLKIWLKRRQKLFDAGVFSDYDALFISIGGGRKYGMRLTKNGLDEMLRRHSHRAGLSEVANPHSFRHHFGHNLARKKANNSTISNMMGHSCLTSSFVYTMFNDYEMEEAYREFHPGDQSFGELPARRFESPATIKKKREKMRNRSAERAALKAKRERQKIKYITQKEEPCNVVIGV